MLFDYYSCFDPQLCVFHHVTMEIALSLMSVNVTLDGLESYVKTVINFHQIFHLYN